MSCSIIPIDVEILSPDSKWRAKISHLLWGFVALGSAIRLIGYVLRFPLCVDECMLAENFLDRGFLALLSPLENNQMAPIGFLWIELACVKLFGFSEWSLRLFPLACGIGSLFVFRHLASRLLAGVPLVLATACLAIAKTPVGLSSDVKPYASDLLVALVLLTLTVEWLRRPDRTTWLWSLTACVPLALLLSFPAAFVGGAISVGLIISVCRRRDGKAWAAYLAYNFFLCGTFAVLLAISAGPQSGEILSFMDEYWSKCGGFPPLSEPARLFVWLIDVHLGDRIFSIPYGAENGGGAVSFICFAVGAMMMFRRNQRSILAILLTTFALTFIAAVMRRYPYGGHIRLVQFLVPAICLTAGLGAATCLGRVTRPDLRWRLAAGLMAVMAAFGAGCSVYQMTRPYHFILDARHREFARRFWQEEPECVTICSLTDLGQDLSPDAWDTYYRCNQRIYSPPHHSGRRLPESTIEHVRQPVRLVIYHPPAQDLDSRALAGCLKQFELHYEPVGREFFEMPLKDDGFNLYGSYEVFRFVPREKLRWANWTREIEPGVTGRQRSSGRLPFFDVHATMLERG